MVVRSMPTARTLSNIYEVFNQLINDEDCFYTDEELKIKKQSDKNIFLKGD